METDILIIGGGPAGSTCGSMLRKIAPDLKVTILEKELFPRDHVGESQLPSIGAILHEMGAWDKVEAAGFPIKIGATYRWGSSDDLWDFNFVPPKALQAEARPAQYTGVRRGTAFQVDRAIYDQILLDHAEELGCEVHQQADVRRIRTEADRVAGVELRDGRMWTAKHVVDASGAAGIVRKAMKVGVTQPTSLQNIAFWDYWENADWAVEIGVGGTRVQVMSLGYGWLWFIPLGPTRTSIGLVIPASYYKEAGQSSTELYEAAILSEPRVRQLTQNATRTGELQGTKDWSFLADRMVGANWYLAGECAGFADPILAAGMSLAHFAGYECAYTIAEIECGEIDREWLAGHYGQRQRARIGQHIRFADYWYSANGHFTDLQEYTRQIAADAGLELDAARAWQWLGTGGFVSGDLGQASFAGHSLEIVKQLGSILGKLPKNWELARCNVLRLNTVDSELVDAPQYAEGRVFQRRALKREAHLLPQWGHFGLLTEALQQVSSLGELLGSIQAKFQAKHPRLDPSHHLSEVVQSLEAMLLEGWVIGSYDPKQPLLRVDELVDSKLIRWNRDKLPVQA